MSAYKSQICLWFFAEIRSQLGAEAVTPSLRLLQSIMAPDSLRALFVVLERLPSILPIAEQICQLDGDKETVRQLIDPSLATCRTLLDRHSEFALNSDLKSLFWDAEKSRPEHFHSTIERAPLYACLGHMAGTVGAPSYDHLLAQTFLATHTIHSSNPQDVTRLAQSYRGVRFLSYPRYAPQLSQLPATPVSSERFSEVIGSIQSATRVEAAAGIFIKAKEGFRTLRAKGADKKSGHPSVSLEDLEDIDDPTVAWTGERSFPTSILTKDEAAQYVADGGSAAELETPSDLIPTPAADHRTINRPTQRDLAFQAKQASNRQALHNQLNWLAWSELSPFDLSILSEYLSGKLEIANRPALEKQVKVCLSFMFWSSSSLERAAKLPIFPTGQPAVNSPEGVYWREGHAPLVRLYSPGPSLAHSPVKRSTLAHAVNQFCHLPLPDIACATLSSNLPELSASSEPVSILSAGAPAEDSIKSLTNQARQILGQLNRSHGCRLSLGRISHCLEHALSRWRGEDLPSAMLYFGFREERPVTRIHYTLAPVRRMEAAYRRSCSDLMAKAGHPVTFHPGYTNEHVNVGTPFSPLPETVQKLASNLREAVEVSRPRSKSLPSIVNFHNHFAIYTACMIAFATGYRAIHDPSFEWADIDLETGLAIIADKNIDAFYNTRLVWIAPACLEQLRHYQQHLMTIYDLFHLKCPPVFQLVKDHSAFGRPLNLFFLHSDLERIELLRPGVLHTLLKTLHKHDLPINSNRHYLKGQLLESGCSPEIIEAFLGHWGIGQEPWTCLSGLHPLDFRNELQKHLVPVLQRDGWIPFRGLQR